MGDVAKIEPELEAGSIRPGPAADDAGQFLQSVSPAPVFLAAGSTRPTAAASVAALALATAACGGGGTPSGGTMTGGGAAPAAVLRPANDAQAARFILRASLSASTSSIEAVKTQGYGPWLDDQMRTANAQSGAQFLAVRGYELVDNNRWYDRQNPADNMIWSQLMSGSNGVRKRAALALSEFFVVSLNSIDIAWRSSAVAAYWDILNDHAFGNFRQLLESITLNPAMGVFLNTQGNRKADPNTGRVADENYGREVMQLFSIGLVELNLDGTPRLGSGGQPIETYTNNDVTEIAKAFTGYDYDYTGVGSTLATDGSNRSIPDPRYARQPMTADPSKWRFPRTSGYHSDEAKSFLGTTIPAQTGAAETLRRTLDTLFQHPNVGPFFARQMIQRLVTSNPAPAYVERVARIFNDNGSGTRGDLRAVFNAVLMDDDALADAGLDDQRFGKLREPIVRFAQFGRTFDAVSASGNWDIGNLSDSGSRLGQAPLRSPSVFNFFRPGYVPAGSQAAANAMLAPEFQIVDESSVAGYVNFMDASIDGRAAWMRDVKARFTEELKIAHDAAALLDRVDLLMSGRQLRPATRDTILGALNAETLTVTSDDAAKLRRIHTAVLLVMVTNDYLVQK